MGSFDLLSAIALVGSVFYLFSAVLVLWRRKYHPQAAGMFFVFCLLSFFWAFGQAAWRLGWLNFLAADFVKRTPTYGIYLLAIVFLFLSRAFLHVDGSGWRRWLSLGIVWTGVLVFLDLNPFNILGGHAMDGSLAMIRRSLVYGVLLAGWAVYMGGAAVQTVQVLRQTSRYHTAGSYWALVLYLIVLGDGLFFTGFPIEGNILCLIGALLAVYVISTPRLAYISHILRNLLSYLIFACAALVLYTICFIVVQLILRSRSDLSPLLASLILAIFMVFLFNPMLNGIRKLTDWWIREDNENPTDLLRQYSQSITNILDLQLLATVAVGTVSELLEVKRGSLLLVEYEKSADGCNAFQLRGVKGMGETNPKPGKLGEESPLAVFFRSERVPVTQTEIDDLPRFRGLSVEERTWLVSLGSEVFVPINAKNEWIGLLCLGPKASGTDYTDQDMAWLSTMADQTAVALQNTRLVEGLVRLNNDFRRAYTALELANRHLERLDRNKSDFISIASHELRTPLTLINGSSQMLLEDPNLQQDPYYRQLLSKIHAGTVRLHEILDSMLDVAKIDARALELERLQVPLYDLVRSVYHEMKKGSTERKQTVEFEDLKALPPIPADQDALRKVFYHLMMNAIKYTPDGGKITISGRVLESNPPDLPNGGVEVVVSDTGIGIDPSFQELIFVKFYQTGELALHSSGKTKFKGSGPGLGLAIARGIVEAHDGKIWVESPGYDEVKCPGSKFHVVLPFRQFESPVSEKKAEKSVEAS